MNRYEQFRQAAIDRGIPEDEVGEFTEYLRFAVWTDTAGEGDEVVGQLGGLPRLPVGTAWPDPLPFIGSVDCAALPRAEGLPLPDDGTLLFFLHHEEDMEAMEDEGTSDYSRVIHVPAGVETEVAPSPRDPDSRTHFCEHLPFLVPERPITAWVQPELPDWFEDRDPRFRPAAVNQLLDGMKHVEQLRELLEELWPSREHGSPLRFGGHCSELGSSDGPFTQMSYGAVEGTGADLSREERSRLRHEEESRLNREWVTFAQFRTQSEFYYGCFLLKLDDLVARRFDEMRSFTMFTE
ncbi:DUF1963 domain-containing protein [Lentzea sp. NPDC060358]|uniref:DUF1963 domain-containing protein n=1 Tax=Lentzea sp. NPDC060358 TaxID=3347103 RepID=UPI00365DBFF0